MLAELDLLLMAGFATAEDLLPWRGSNARRSVTDAELVTFAVARAIVEIPSDREVVAVARSRLRRLIAKLPTRPGFWKRRARLAERIEWLTAMFAPGSPGYLDDVVLVDSAPVECGRSVDSARRSRLAPACAHHHSRSHSRWFGACAWICSPPPTEPRRAAILAAADPRERDASRPPGRARPRAGARLDPPTDRVRSSGRSRTAFGLERHRARTLHGLRARIATTLLALAAGV